MQVTSPWMLTITILDVPSCQEGVCGPFLSSELFLLVAQFWCSLLGCAGLTDSGRYYFLLIVLGKAVHVASCPTLLRELFLERKRGHPLVFFVLREVQLSLQQLWPRATFFPELDGHIFEPSSIVGLC